MIPLLLGLSTTAAAFELDLQLGIPGAAPVAVTLHEVAPGPMPALMIPSPDGGQARLSARLSPVPESDLAWQIDFLLERVEIDRHGRERATVISRPTMRANADQEALFQMGQDTPDGGFDGYSIGWTLRGQRE